MNSLKLQLLSKCGLTSCDCDLPVTMFSIVFCHWEQTEMYIKYIIQPWFRFVTGMIYTDSSFESSQTGLKCSPRTSSDDIQREECLQKGKILDESRADKWHRKVSFCSGCKGKTWLMSLKMHFANMIISTTQARGNNLANTPHWKDGDAVNICIRG